MKFNSLIGSIQRTPRVITLGATSLLLAASGSVLAQDSTQQERQQAQQEQQVRQAEQDRPTITVDQQQPRVQVNQPPTKVTAEQQKMDVQVRTGEPEVSIQQPDPEVQVQQQEPEVTIQQSEPRVIVESAEPQVKVNQAEPQVMVNSAEPEVRIIDESGQERSIQAQTTQQPQQQQQAQQEQAQQQQQPQQAQAGSLMQAQLSELKDKEVYTSQGEELGAIEDIVVDPNTGQAGFVVGLGGVLGLGEEKVFVPAEQSAMQGEQIIYQTQNNPEQIQQNAQYQEDQYISIAELEGSLQDARNSAMQRAER